MEVKKIIEKLQYNKKILIIVLAIICATTIYISCYFLIFNKSNKEYSNVKYEKYYKVSYESTYRTRSYLKYQNNNYEIVDNQKRAKEILKKIKHNEFIEIFNDDFFYNSNLVFFEGGIGASVQECEIKDDSIKFLIYNATPLTSIDQKWDFNMFFVPINKKLTNIDIHCTVYPGVDY